MIFVCGNESATQDPDVKLKTIAEVAVRKGIIINTIFCGSPLDVVAAGWKEFALQSEGRFAAIDQNLSALDPSNFGKGRPRAANGTIAFRPVLRDRRRPAAVASLQERNRYEERYSLERLRVHIKLNSGVAKPLAVLAERGFE